MTDEQQKFSRTHLREWRKFRKLTQERLAEKAGFVASYISMLETGERGYTLETLETLAQALDISVGMLVDEHPAKTDGLSCLLKGANADQRSEIAKHASIILTRSAR